MLDSGPGSQAHSSNNKASEACACGRQGSDAERYQEWTLQAQEDTAPEQG